MKYRLSLLALFLFSLTPAFGQVQAQSDMKALARALVVHIPEIDRTIGEPDETGENLFRYYMRDSDDDGVSLQIYRYKRPDAVSDLALVAYDENGSGVFSWIRCFTVDRSTGALAETALPFRILNPSEFDPDEFKEDHGYWRIGYRIFDNGDVLISPSPGMMYICEMLVRWEGNDVFTVFRRAAYSFFLEVVDDDAETERYVQNVVRHNFQRINAIREWAFMEEKEVFDLSTEGATLTYYYSADGLEKIVAKLLGETGVKTVEYYFLGGLLSFVYDVSTHYGDPINRTSAPGKPNTQTERRWYLKGNTCIRGIGDNGKKLTPARIEEEFANREKGAYNLYTSVIGR